MDGDRFGEATFADEITALGDTTLQQPSETGITGI